MTIHRRRVLFPLLMAVLLMALASGVALGKAHVPADEIQVAHRGIVKQLPSEALGGHLAHGDIQLPACDFNNVFLEGGDASGVVDADMDGKADFANRDEAATSACPPGTF